jgi:hypothetical protein
MLTLQRIKAGFDAEWASPTDLPLTGDLFQNMHRRLS